MVTNLPAMQETLVWELGRTAEERIGYPLQYSWASFVVQLIKNPPAMQETWVNPWVREVPWKRDRLPTPVLLGFPGGSVGKESACNAGHLGSIPGLGRSPGGHDNPLYVLYILLDYIVRCSSQTLAENVEKMQNQ